MCVVYPGCLEILERTGQPVIEPLEELGYWFYEEEPHFGVLGPSRGPIPGCYGGWEAYRPWSGCGIGQPLEK